MLKYICLAFLALALAVTAAEIPVDTGLVVWLRSDSLDTSTPGATVNTWFDRTGTLSLGDGVGHNAALLDGGPVLSTSTINGHNPVAIGGGGSYQHLGAIGISGSQAPFTSFLVGNSTGGTASQRLLQLGDVNGPSPGGSSVAIEVGTSGVRYNNGNSLFGGAHDWDSTYRITEVSMNSSSTYGGATGPAWLNNGTVATESGSSSPTATTNIDDQGYILGRGVAPGGGPSNNEWFTGNVAEILIYDNDLSLADSARVAHYLSQRYNIPTTYATPGGIIFDDASPANSLWQTPTNWDLATTPLASQTATINAPLTVELNNQNAAINGISGNGEIDLGSATLTVGAANGTSTFAGTVSGTGGITKSGIGMLTLSGTKSYTGDTTVSNGTLRLQNTGINTGTYDIAAGSFLELNATVNRSTGQPFIFNGGGTVAKTGGGALTFRSRDSIIELDGTGLIDVQAGALINGAGVLSVWTNNLADMRIASGARFEGENSLIYIDALDGAGEFRNGDGIILGVNNGNGDFSGTIVDDGNGDDHSLTKRGTGTQILSGNNAYTGGTTVDAGILRGGSLQAFGVPGSTITLNGGKLELSQGTSSGDYVYDLQVDGTAQLDVTANRKDWKGSISGNGSLEIVNGSADLRLASDMSGFSGTLIFNGQNELNLMVDDGAFGTAATTSGSADAAFEINSGRVYLLNNNQAGTAFMGSLAGTGGIINSKYARSGNVTLEIGALNTSTTFSGIIADGNTGGTTTALKKVGTGTLTLAGNNTYTGGTTIGDGNNESTNIIGVGHDNAFGDSTGPITVLGAGISGVGAPRTIANGLNLGTGGGNAAYFAGTDLTFTGPISLETANRGIHVSNTTEFSGIVGNGGFIRKEGTGTLVLSANNTFTDRVEVTAGVVEITDGGALGTNGGTNTVSNGASLVQNTGTGDVPSGEALTIAGAGTASQPGALVGYNPGDNMDYHGPITLTGDASIAVSGDAGNPDVGEFVIQGGIAIGTRTLTLDHAAGNPLNDLIVNTVPITGASSTDGQVRIANSTGNGGEVYFGGGANHSFENLIVDPGATLRLNNNNALNSVFRTYVNGTLRLGSATGAQVQRLQGSGTVTSTAGGHTLVTRGTSTFSGTIENGAGTTGLQKTGGGTFTLSGNNTYTGRTQVSGGTLRVTGSIDPAGHLYMTGNGSVFEYASSSDVTLAGETNFRGNTTVSVTGGGVLTLAGANIPSPDNLTTTLAGTGTGKITAPIAFGFADHNIIKSGTGTWILENDANNHEGATTVNNGTLQIGDGGTSGNLAGTTGVAVNAPGTLSFNRDSFTFNRQLSGNGTIANDGSGTTTINNAGNTFAGTYNINDGGFAFASVGAFGSPTQVNLDSSASPNFDLSAITGTLAPANPVTFSGNGQITIGGTLQWNNNVTLDPGNSPGTLPIVGDVDWSGASGGGTYLWELLDFSGTTPGFGGQWDLITVNGTLDLAGGSGIINMLADVPGPIGGFPATDLKTTETFTILTASNITGFDSFTPTILNNLGVPLRNYFLGYDAGTQSLFLSLTTVPEPGTYALLALLLLAGYSSARRRRQ